MNYFPAMKGALIVLFMSLTIICGGCVLPPGNSSPVNPPESTNTPPADVRPGYTNVWDDGSVLSPGD